MLALWRVAWPCFYSPCTTEKEQAELGESGEGGRWNELK